MTNPRAASPPTDAAPTAREWIAFGAALSSYLLLASPEIANMAKQWTWSSSYHHGWIAGPIALWLFHESGAWRGRRPTIDLIGVLPLSAALALLLAGRLLDAQLFGHVAVVAGVVSVSLLTLGRAMVGKAGFAFGFLIFMIPFGESLVPALQSASATSVAFLLNATGFQTTLDGLILTTAAGRFEMAESCAGLRFLLAAAMIASLAAHLAFMGLPRKLLFVAAALLLAVGANWLRAFVIVAAATASDMRIGTGPEHVAFGWVLYGGLIVALLLIARRFADRAAALAPAAAFVR
jgi:exosortase